MKFKKLSVLLSLLLALSVFITSPKSVEAQEKLSLISNPDLITFSSAELAPNTNLIRNPKAGTIDSDLISPQNISLPNGVYVTINPDEYGLTVKVTNIGLDSVDRVDVEINSTRMYSQSGTNSHVVTFTRVGIGSTSKTISIPMVRTKMDYNGVVTIWEAGKTVYKSTSSSLELSDEQLSSDWLIGGGFSTLRDSIDHHFEKHYNDRYVKVKTMPEYLRMASLARYEMKDITSDTVNYTVTNPSFNSRKITSKITKRYILIDTSSKKLYSFGGN